MENPAPAAHTQSRGIPRQSWIAGPLFGVCDELKIDFFPASNPHPTFFVLGACSDADTGGFVVGEMAKNIGICVSEKTAKIAPYRDKYPEWWLLLVDLIGFGLGEYDQKRGGVPSSGSRLGKDRDFRSAKSWTTLFTRRRVTTQECDQSAIFTALCSLVFCLGQAVIDSRLSSQRPLA